MDNSVEDQKASQERLLYFHYDEYCDLAGGAPWEPSLERWFLSGLSPERRHALTHAAARYSSPRQFLFEEDLTGKYPLEVLWIKWNLFSQLSRDLLSFHRDHLRPHLGIRPFHVFITTPDKLGSFIPARWGVALNINRSAASPPYRNPEIPPDLASRLFDRPQDIQSAYSAPVIREKIQGQEERVTGLIRAMERIRETTGDAVRGILQVHIVSENIRPSEYTEMDVFRVDLSPSAEKGRPFTIWAGKITSSEHGLSLKGISDPVTPLEWEALERGSKNVFLNSKLVIYPTYHVPCDLYSLGMMLFRTLLVNDAQDFMTVTQAVHHIAGSLEPMVQGIEPDLERKILLKRFRTRLIEEGRVFLKDSILFQKEKRDQARGCYYVPDPIWFETLILAYRLTTFIPKFSFCSHHGDYDPENPQVQMERVMRGVNRIAELIKIELFGSQRRNREVLEVCDLIRRQLSQRESAADAG